MGGEDKLDPEAFDKALHLLGTHPSGLELHHGCVDGFADRAAAVLPEGVGHPASAQQYDAEILLGQIHELKVEGEGHRLVECLLRVEV